VGHLPSGGGGDSLCQLSTEADAFHSPIRDVVAADARLKAYDIASSIAERVACRVVGALWPPRLYP